MKKSFRPQETRFAAFVASSVDGRISLTARSTPEWTSKEDWKFLQTSLKRFEAVVVGRNTFLAAKKRLMKRTTYVLSRSTPSKTRGSVTFVNPRKAHLEKILSKHASVAVLGAGEVYQYMLDHNLLQRLYVTVEPLVFGRGKPMFSGGKKNHRLQLRSVRKLNKKGTLLLTYDVST